VKNTNLQTEFLLQIRKQQEDSAILLASNRPQHKDKTKNRPTEKEKQNFQGKDSKEQTKNKILQRACILLTVCQLYNRQNHKFWTDQLTIGCLAPNVPIE
jgi:hypothetical protein